MARAPKQIEDPEMEDLIPQDDLSVLDAKGTEAPPKPPVPPDVPDPAYDYQPINPDDAAGKIKPFNGNNFYVSDSETEHGVLAKYYTTRKVRGWRWSMWQGWIDPVTKQELDFEPLFWRELF